MKYRQLGSSDLSVSEISLGSWLTYGVGVEADSARRCLDTALDVGINFIDTANVYGAGAAESFLGGALTGRPRDSYVLATKVFFPMDAENRGLSRAQILKQIDASLSRLKTDFVDLYQCHRYDDATPLAETMATLTDVVAAGKARYIGFSEWPADKIQAALDMVGVEKFVSSQPQYSLVHRDPEDKVIPLCGANGISQIVWSPLGQGVLTGKYQPGKAPPPGSRATNDRMNDYIGGMLREPLLVAVEKLKPLADEANLSPSQFALAWILREPNIASAIIGASRPEQVIDNAGASGAIVAPELFARAEAIIAEGMSIR